MSEEKRMMEERERNEETKKQIEWNRTADWVAYRVDKQDAETCATGS